MTSPLKVCYILSYYSPNYTRTATLVAGLKKVKGLKLFQARNRSSSLLRYLETFLRLVVIRLRRRPDLYILGFRGYELYWFVRLLTIGKPLIYDHMMSPYDSLTGETGKIDPASTTAKALHVYEKAILHNASLVLTDTSLSKEYLIERFQLAEQRVATLPVGADEQLFFPRKAPRITAVEPQRFRVLFYGSFLPLHGVEIILHAACYLRDLPLTFQLIGGNRVDLSSFFHKMDELTLENVAHTLWMPYDQLPNAIAESDLILGGPFGNTGQASRVITGKTFQALAMAKATVVGEIAADYGFRDKENCLKVAQGNAEQLASVLRWAFDHREHLPRIGARGRMLFEDHFSANSIAAAFQSILVRVR